MLDDRRVPGLPNGSLILFDADRCRGSEAVLPRLALEVGVFEKRCSDHVVDMLVADDEVALEHVEHATARPLGYQPSGDIRHQQVRQDLGIVGEVFGHESLDVRVGGLEVAQEVAGRRHLKWLRIRDVCAHLTPELSCERINEMRRRRRRFLSSFVCFNDR